jgi:Tfp pilus assembly protein PilZ
MALYETGGSGSAQHNAVRDMGRAPVEGRIFIHDEEKLYIAPIVDISEAGCFVAHLTALTIGAKVRAVIKSPALGSPIQIVGTVMGVETGNRSGVAIGFTKVSDEARKRIARHVASSKSSQQLGDVA